jgi:hypothetical protein
LKRLRTGLTPFLAPYLPTACLLFHAPSLVAVTAAAEHVHAGTEVHLHNTKTQEIKRKGRSVTYETEIEKEGAIQETKGGRGHYSLD